MIILVLGAVAWLYRWKISRTAVTVADPLVRAWAANQVLDASDSVYQFTASTIVIDDANRRLAIDSITVTTDSARNNRLAKPHPDVTLRLHRCALTGIDLTQLAAARGLHALHAGCDSASIDFRTLVAPAFDTTVVANSPDSNNFLRFQGKLDLPGVLPFVNIDVVAFPHVHVAFDLLAQDGRRTQLAADSVAVELDSVRVDPHEAIAKRRPLFSKDISVRLDRFEGNAKNGTHFSLEHLVADLEDGTCRLDAVGYDTPEHSFVRAQHIALAGVRWRTFLLSGDMSLSRINLDSISIRLVALHPPKVQHPPKTPPRLAELLRGIGRTVQVDSVSVKSVRLADVAYNRDSAVTTVRQLQLAHVAFRSDSSWWARPNPIGQPTLRVDRLLHHTANMDISLAHMVIDGPARQFTIDSLRAAPPGGDSAFLRQHPYRKARLALSMAHVAANGIDLEAFVRRGALRTRSLDVRALVLDVMSDKNKPEDPGPNVVRRYPQQVMRDAETEIQVDTITGAGLVTYRERDDNSKDAGTLSFGAIQLHGYNFSTDPARMTAATPFRLIGDARLMGAGAMHVEWDVPLLASDFSMRWHGSLGTMDPKAMNAFLPDAVGMKFIDGVFEGATWDATISNGLAKGVLSPVWRGMKVDFPGISRDKPGLIGGLMRGVTKFAANTFGIRSDNDSANGNQPIKGTINHQWLTAETLPQFIWIQLREPLLLVLKK